MECIIKMIPVFDHKLVKDAETLATGEDVHGLRSRIAIYKNNFYIVENGISNWDSPWAYGLNRAEYTEAVAKEIRAMLVKSKLRK
jgi:hypothetical protein